ncbi:hypothetical protein [Rhodoferax ferrireducens]|nr:hypothetical protein [Rhodoferax ferrireducens]
MGVQRAMYEVKAIPLANAWAYKTACEKFGDGLVETFPRFSRGPRKGSLKGYLCYIKATVGGWAENLPGGRGVLFPGTSDWKLAMAAQVSDPKGHSVVATWDFGGGAKQIQTPEQADKLFKTYGESPRYS